jgi:hypothetical protein
MLFSGRKPLKENLKRNNRREEKRIKRQESRQKKLEVRENIHLLEPAGKIKVGSGFNVLR